jgi:uncharacterized membrane protein
MSQDIPSSPRERIQTIDLLRGAVMIIMALDHVRDFFTDRIGIDPVDLSKTSPALFMTRWITHYCAPTFIFLAGTSAYLAGQRRAKPELSWFLFTRGLWLALFEVTVNRAMWMFNFDWHHHGAGVFWAIGWAMVALAGLVFLPARAVGMVGLFIIGLHNLLDGMIAEQFALPEWIWMILHSPAEELPVAAGYWFGTGYCLIPWIGVMAAGYGFGQLWVQDRSVRRPQLFQLGAALTLLFVVVRGINIHGDPNPWSVQPTPAFTIFSFLNCTKYPASLSYVLMTLGPAILVLAIFDRPLGDWARPVIIFGRVPLFFYVLHIVLIHGGAVLLDFLRFGWSPLWPHGPWEVFPYNVPPDYGVGLPWVYLIWVVLVFVLYPPCRWYADFKHRHRSAWLSYL